MLLKYSQRQLCHLCCAVPDQAGPTAVFLQMGMCSLCTVKRMCQHCGNASDGEHRILMAYPASLGAFMQACEMQVGLSMLLTLHTHVIRDSSQPSK